MNKVLKYELLAVAALLVVALGVRIWLNSMPPVTLQAAADTEPAATTTAPTTAPTSEPTVPPTFPKDVRITWKTYPADRTLTARKAFVYDCVSDSFAFLHGSETDQVYPASITKLFALHVALLYLDPDQTVTAGDALDLVGELASVAEIQKGDVLTVEMLVQGTLMPSGCDATYILAAETGRHLSADSTLPAAQAVELFVEEMNRQAQLNGMTGSHFVTPDGNHDENHYTCLADIVTIAKLVMANETMMQFTHISNATVTFESGRNQTWENTNLLLTPVSPYYCPYAIGLKTGRTNAAGSCLLSVFEIEGSRCIIGVFDCPQREDRFDDALQLLNQFLEN